TTTRQLFGEIIEWIYVHHVKDVIASESIIWMHRVLRVNEFCDRTDLESLKYFHTNIGGKVGSVYMTIVPDSAVLEIIGKSKCEINLVAATCYIQTVVGGIPATEQLLEMIIILQILVVAFVINIIWIGHGTGI